MYEKEIEILIDKDGKISVEAFGFKGQGCEEAIKFLTQGLGRQLEVYNKNEHSDKQHVQIDQHIG